MNRKRVVAVVAAIAVLGAGVAWAAGSSSRNPERARQFMTWKVDDALDDLEASKAQREKLHQIKDRLFDDGMRLRDTRRELHDGLVEQWKSARPDPAAVHGMVDEMIEDLRAFAHRAADAAIELHGTLTPEQRAELLQKTEDRHRRWHR